MFKALSDGTRLRVIRLMVADRERRSVSELVDILKLPQYSLSRQLKVLRQAGLLSREKRGRHVYYRLSQEVGGELLWELIRKLPDFESVPESVPESAQGQARLDNQRRQRAGQDSKSTEGEVEDVLPSHLL